VWSNSGQLEELKEQIAFGDKHIKKGEGEPVLILGSTGASLLIRMIKFLKKYPQEICATLSQQLCLSHIIRLTSIEDE
jgi:hypothetical protein